MASFKNLANLAQAFFEKQAKAFPPSGELEGGFWIGGDAYSAVAVAKKIGTDS